jgi:hypothetical protein
MITTSRTAPRRRELVKPLLRRLPPLVEVDVARRVGRKGAEAEVGAAALRAVEAEAASDSLQWLVWPRNLPPIPAN